MQAPKPDTDERIGDEAQQYKGKQNSKKGEIET